MALDPSIALGVRPIELPNQLAQYGQLAAIQNAQNQNALAQYQLSSAQRAEAKDIARTNALANAGADDSAIAKALLNSGDLKGYVEFLKTRRETQKADVDLADSKLKQSRGFLDTLDPADPNAPAQYIAWHEANHKDPILGPLLASRGVTAEQSRARIMDAISKGPAAFATLINQSKLGSEKFIELNKPTTNVVNRSGSSDVVQTPGLGGVPTTVGTYADTPFPKTVEEQKARIALAGRAPAQPRVEPAPTVTSIQDPTNPNQMISINARDYRGGGVGSPGVIGLTGKTPAATAKQDAIDKGHAQLASVVDDLRSSYDTLEKAAAIPSTKRGTISNLMSSAQASGIGQALGRMGGTEEQSARDTINSSRMMLLNSIKQATGMSAQQLNSNVELTSWLKAVSDPTQSTETVNKILGNIEKFVESGGKYSAKKDSAAAATPPAANAVTNPQFPGFSVKKP